MENDSLISALRKAESEKFAAIPEEAEIEHAFSDGFQQKMDRLIRIQRNPVWDMVKTPVRRSMLFLMILLAAFGVPAEKNPLFRLAQPIPQLSASVSGVPEKDAQPNRTEDTAVPPAPPEEPTKERPAPPESSVRKEQPQEKPTSSLHTPSAADAVSRAAAETPAVTSAPSETAVRYEASSTSAPEMSPAPDAPQTPEPEINVPEQKNDLPEYIPLENDGASNQDAVRYYDLWPETDSVN